MANETYRIDVPLKVSDHTEPGISKGIKNLSRFDEANKKTQKQLDKMSEDTYKLPIEVVDRVSGPLEIILSLIGDYNGELRSLAESGSKINIPIVNRKALEQGTNRPSSNRQMSEGTESSASVSPKGSGSENGEMQTGIQKLAEVFRTAYKTQFNVRGGFSIAIASENVSNLKKYKEIALNLKKEFTLATNKFSESQKVVSAATMRKLAKESKYKKSLEVLSRVQNESSQYGEYVPKRLSKQESIASKAVGKSHIELQEATDHLGDMKNNSAVRAIDQMKAEEKYRSAQNAVNTMEESMQPKGFLTKTNFYKNASERVKNARETISVAGKNLIGKGIETFPKTANVGRKVLDFGGNILKSGRDLIGKGLEKNPSIVNMGKKIFDTGKNIMGKEFNPFKNIPGLKNMKAFKNIKGVPLIGNLIGLGASMATIAAAPPEERGRETAGEVGSWVGSIGAGAGLGATFGLVGGPVAAAVGGVIGGIGGAIGGEKFAEWAYDKKDALASVGNNVKNSIFDFFSGKKNKSSEASNIEKQTQSELAIQPHMNYATGTNSGEMGIVGASGIIGGLLGGPIGNLLGGTIGGLGKTLGGEKLTDWIKDKTDSITTFGNTLKALIPNPSMTNEAQSVPTTEFSDELVPVKALRNTPQNDIKINLELKTEPKITIENHSELNNESNIISLLRSYIREMTDDIGDELANKLTHIFSNMPEMEVE